MTDDYREGGTLILQRPIGPSDDEKQPPTGDACLVNLHPPGPDIGKRVPLLNTQYIVGRDMRVLHSSFNDSGFSILVHSDTPGDRYHARLPPRA